jgi:hypothetical protein
MGISGLITAFIGQTLTEGPGTGTGAYTSLVCTGVVSGLIANLMALYVRSGFKSFLKINIFDFNTWFQTAAFTYPICGLLAGLLCALLVFKLKNPSNNR